MMTFLTCFLTKFTAEVGQYGVCVDGCVQTEYIFVSCLVVGNFLLVSVFSQGVRTVVLVISS